MFARPQPGRLATTDDLSALADEASAQLCNRFGEHFKTEETPTGFKTGIDSEALGLSLGLPMRRLRVGIYRKKWASNGSVIMAPCNMSDPNTSLDSSINLLAQAYPQHLQMDYLDQTASFPSGSESPFPDLNAYDVLVVGGLYLALNTSQPVVGKLSDVGVQSINTWLKTGTQWPPRRLLCYFGHEWAAGGGYQAGEFNYLLQALGLGSRYWAAGQGPTTAIDPGTGYPTNPYKSTTDPMTKDVDALKSCASVYGLNVDTAAVHALGNTGATLWQSRTAWNGAQLPIIVQEKTQGSAGDVILIGTSLYTWQTDVPTSRFPEGMPGGKSQSLSFSTGSSTPNGGVFVLTVLGTDGKTVFASSPIPYNATFAALSTAVKNLYISAGWTSVSSVASNPASGSCPSNVTLTFGNGTWPTMVADVSGLTATSGTPTLTITVSNVPSPIQHQAQLLLNMLTCPYKVFAQY